MKAILFAVMTILATSASAAESISINTKLTRNGETVYSFAGITTNGEAQPHRNIELIKYRGSVTNGKVKFADLEVGTTASITPVITADGEICLSFSINYVKLKNMEKAKVGSNIYIDTPHTVGFRLSSSTIIPDGGMQEYKSHEDGVEYIYTVSATKQ